MRVTDDNASFFFTTIYGSPRAVMRKALWKNLEVLAPIISTPWLLAGDFNATLSTVESSKPRRSPSYSTQAFQECLINSGLMDFGFTGPLFTWHRGTLRKCLDRALGNPEWSATFTQAQVYHLPYLSSDHRPLLIVPDISTGVSHSPQRFLFKAAWMTHENFENFGQQNWDGNQPWSRALEEFSKKLLVWQSLIFGSTVMKKRRLLARLQGIQEYLDRKPSHFLYNLELELRCEIDKVLAQEELEWFQRSRCQWLKWGDRNTSYFHLSTQIQKRKSKTLALKDKIFKSLVWRIGDGHTVRFWLDKWTPSRPLSQLLSSPINESTLLEKVACYADAYGQWEWGRFCHLLPVCGLDEIAAIAGPTQNRGSDRLCWASSTKGNFTTKSVYQLLEEEHWPLPDKSWELILRWNGPQRPRGIHYAYHTGLSSRKELMEFPTGGPVYSPISG
ncbi:hypothetical protein Tsubulata_006816 [Turnera subulata]|uniref:Endonuclease/exonuclease/phosphatase domain-containing protein n=1 Tax=Turnera subulata TaxID=218843 RepID=A0A9Q0F9Y3_9ROSI|nr:hypothetical protein Tsubulata_006816 [Turnera subulata]